MVRPGNWAIPVTLLAATLPLSMAPVGLLPSESVTTTPGSTAPVLSCAWTRTIGVRGTPAVPATGGSRKTIVVVGTAMEGVRLPSAASIVLTACEVTTGVPPLITSSAVTASPGTGSKRRSVIWAQSSPGATNRVAFVMSGLVGSGFVMSGEGGVTKKGSG